MLENDNNMSFSVTMSVYKNDDPGYLRTAIHTRMNRRCRRRNWM